MTSVIPGRIEKKTAGGGEQTTLTHNSTLRRYSTVRVTRVQRGTGTTPAADTPYTQYWGRGNKFPSPVSLAMGFLEVSGVQRNRV